jgi:site-specific recombinase XerD
MFSLRNLKSEYVLDELEIQREQLAVRTCIETESAALFLNPSGKRISTQGIANVIERIREQAGIARRIAALNGSHSASVVVAAGVTRKRTMSAAARAKISKATKARWAKFRAEKAKKPK